MSILCTRLTDPGMKEKGSSSASMVRDAHWVSPGDKPNTQEFEIYPTDSDGVVLAQWRKRILDVAEEHIRRIGHRKTTVADIAFDLGISRANVYRFFPTRAAIDQDVCARIANRALDAARAISRRRDSAGIRLAAIFDYLHRQARMRLMEEPYVHALFIVATQGQWEVAKWYFAEIAKMFEAIIGEGLETGELKGDDAGNAARCVMAAIVPFVHPSLVEERFANGDDVKSELEAQTRFVIRALGNEPV